MILNPLKSLIYEITDVGEGDGDGDGDGVGEGDGLGDGDGVGEGDGLGDGVGPVLVTVGLGEGVGEEDGLGEGVGVTPLQFGGYKSTLTPDSAFAGNAPRNSGTFGCVAARL